MTGTGGQPSARMLETWLVKCLKAIVLIFLGFQTLFWDVFPIAEEPIALRSMRIIGTVMYGAGLATAVTGRIQLGRSWADLEEYRVLPEQTLVTTGIYRYIRHPIYTGDTFLLIGLELALNSWLVLGAIGIALVVVRQALAEEALLAREFPGYHAYCSRTRMFIPFIL